MARAPASHYQPYTKSSWDNIRVSVEWVTPTMARDLRTSCHFEHQRQLSDRHISFLANEMSKGWFLEGTPIWFCVLPDTSMVIVNGNHTLEAVAKSGVSIPLTFVCQNVRNMAHAADVYACFDIQRTRTLLQAAQAKGIDKTLPMAKETLSSLSFIQKDFAFNFDVKSSRHARFDLVDEYTKPAAILKECFHGAPSENMRPLKRTGIFAVALATTRYQPEKAETFWRGVAWDDGLRTDDPRKTLLRYLMGARGTGVSNQQRTDVVAASVAWNAAFEDRKLTLIRIPATPTMRIAGTPWADLRGVKAKKDKAEMPSMVQQGTMINARGESVPVAQFVG